MKPLVLVALAALALSACATAPTLYQPLAARGGVGYSDYRIEPGRYRITFRGGPGAPAQQVADYALLRAADLALADGYDWFRVADRVSEVGGGGGGSRLSVGIGAGGFGRHTGVGLGVNQGIDLSGGPSLISTIEVVMGKGERPRGVDIYDARALRQNIGPRSI